MKRVSVVWMSTVVLAVAASAAAATIDLSRFDRPWPHEWSHRYEVGRHLVDWRQGGNRARGTFTHVQCTVPLPQQTVWDLSTDFSHLGRMTPAVKAVHILEHHATQQVIEVDLHVFWKIVRLTFAIDQEPPGAMQFRLLHNIAGQCQGVCLLTPAPQSPRSGQAASVATTIELWIWVKPHRHIPTRLLWFVERTTILQGVRAFLAACDAHDSTALPKPKHEDSLLPGRSP